MSTITVEQAQADLSNLIRQLEPGHEVVFTENDKPVARLIVESSKPSTRPGPGLWKGKLTVVTDDDAQLADFAEHLP